MNAFPHLLSPIRLGGLALKNRALMGAMHTGLAETGDWGRVAAFYAARARGGAGLIVTGGHSPEPRGEVLPGAVALTAANVADHRRVTDAVHAEGGHILLQILHAGRYAPGPDCVAPSALRAPISRHLPRALEAAEIPALIDAFATLAGLAMEAGYDGVEIMGSEGYLLNQFLSPATNRRSDEWGGDAARRAHLVLGVVARIREVIGREAALIYRISLADLVPGGQPWDEIVALARAVEQAGVDALDAGIGWHESRVPTIAAMVPRAAFADLAARLKREVGIPVIAANRINTPSVAEDILARGMADMVSMARPWLADPDFIAKAAAGRVRDIAPCIACNQSCLDNIFAGRVASCLVNPRAGHETELVLLPAARPMAVAVVGAGPAGMAAAIAAAGRGHRVTLFERSAETGGQLDLARRVPGKEEFAALLAWFRHSLAHPGIALRLGVDVTPRDLAGFDAVIVATGTVPHDPGIPTEAGARVLGHAEVLRGAPVGSRVAVIGAGGIGVDTAHFLVTGAHSTTMHPDEWRREWGVAPPWEQAGGLTRSEPPASAREVWLLQRRPGVPGRGPGRTTGWIHRAGLQAMGAHLMGGLVFERITRGGVVVRHGDDGHRELIAADSVVLCTGQEPAAELPRALVAAGIACHLVGGAAEAGRIDAARAIEQAMRLVAHLGDSR